ncbi:hypothetical protein SH467x_004261 [Pirellulaceae bacterium SH467]
MNLRRYRMEASKTNGMALGFLTVRKHAAHGYFGGLLVLNHLARPLEFHCTLPVMTTRAQQILYGSTLDEFVCGEQIARALVLKAKSAPSVLFTDTPASLSLRHIHSLPIAAIDGSWHRGSSTFSQPHLDRADLQAAELGGHKLLVLPEYHKDLESFANIFQSHEPNIDLIEPFGRIEEALREAHPATKAA